MKQLSDLEFFVELARHPSLASAAVAFDVTAPAVSRRLAALEHRLGVRLLNRSTRRMALSFEGEQYVEQGKRLLADIAGLEHALRGTQESPRGVLRVNASFGFGRKHVADVVADFCARFSQVEVVLELTDHPLDLIAHSIDVAIRFGEPPDQRLIAQALASNRRILCAAPGYLKRAPALDQPADLTRHNCLVIRQENHTANNWALQNGKQSTTVKVHGGLSSNDGEVVVRWALEGRGVMLRSEWDVVQELKDGRLVRVLPQWAGTAADIYAVCPQARPLPAKSREFIAMMKAHMARGGWPGAVGL